MRFVLLFFLLISVLPSRGATTQEKLDAIKKYRTDVAHTINAAEQKASLNNFRGQTNQNINTTNIAQYTHDFVSETSGEFNYDKYNNAYKKYKSRVNSAINTSAQSKSRNSFNLSFFNNAETAQLQRAKDSYMQRSGSSPEGWKMHQAHEEFKIKANKAYDMEKFDKKYTQLESAADKAKDLKRFSDARQSFLDSTGTEEDEARFRANRDEFSEIANTSTEDLIQRKKDMMEEGGAFDEEESEIDEAKESQDKLDAEAKEEEEAIIEEATSGFTTVESVTIETSWKSKEDLAQEIKNGQSHSYTSDINLRKTLFLGSSEKYYLKYFVFSDSEVVKEEKSSTWSSSALLKEGSLYWAMLGGSGTYVNASSRIPQVILSDSTGKPLVTIVDINGVRGLQDFGPDDDDYSGGGGPGGGPGGGGPGGGGGGEEGEEQDPDEPKNSADTASEFPALDRFLTCLDKFTFGDVSRKEISFDIMNTTISTENGLSSLILSASRAFSVFVISIFLGMQIFKTLRQW